LRYTTIRFHSNQNSLQISRATKNNRETNQEQAEQQEHKSTVTKPLATRISGNKHQRQQKQPTTKNQQHNEQQEKHTQRQLSTATKTTGTKTTNNTNQQEHTSNSNNNRQEQTWSSTLSKYSSAFLCILQVVGRMAIRSEHLTS